MSASVPVLAVAGIEKSFPGVRALNGVSFECRAGEIHGLVGENGAGKSTLMRVLAGVHAPDRGTIEVRGRPVVLPSPSAARDLGIAMVYQDTRLVPDLDVAQNIWLGREPMAGPLLVDRARMDRDSRAILARLGLDIDPRLSVADLSQAERQIVEIARALTADPAVLILDEPTSALDPGEVARLFRILRALRRAGTGIVFISHRLPEVMALVDRVTVMKDGEVVGTVDREGLTEERLVSLMVGREIALAYPPKAERLGEPVLTVEGLSVPGALSGVAFTLRAGEILGIGGIQGNGQRALVRALAGLEAHGGRIAVDGRPVRLSSPARALSAGLVYIPADRRGEGLFLPHSVAENIALPHLRDWATGGLVPAGRERRTALAAIEELRVRTPSAAQPVGLLSGGNQQKVVFGRAMAGRPRVYLLEEPTQGVDVETKLELYRRIRALAEEGAAVLLVSSDVLELIGLSDRVLVLSRGRIVDTVPAAEATEERIVGSAVTDLEEGAEETADRDRPEPHSGAHPAAHPATTDGTGDRRRPPGLLGRYAPSLLLAVLIVALVGVTASQSDYFLTGRNFTNLAIQIAPLAIVALGQLAVVLLGGIDLSVGPSVSLTTAIASFLAIEEAAGDTLLAVATALLAGLVVGGVNAALILRLRIPDLIATLATFSVVTGAALILRPAPGGMISLQFMDAFSVTLGPVPLAALLILLAYGGAELLLARGRLGLRLYATGSSHEAARLVGIRVDVVRAGAYLFCGVCAAIGGLLIAARIGSGDPQAGTQFTLMSVTAVVVGGASLFGGRGTAIGALLGAIAVGTMQNALNQMHVSAYWQYVWAGALTLIAVAAYSIRLRRAG